MKTTHTMPTPAVAGWTEEERLSAVADVRAEFATKGGTVISERRKRNTAFDRTDERTTFEFVVEWS